MKKVSLALLIVLLAGCNGKSADLTSRKYNYKLSRELERGHSTKSDVSNSLGAPDKITYLADGREMWKYQNNSNSLSFIPGISESDAESLALVFSSDGRLFDYDYVEK